MRRVWDDDAKRWLNARDLSVRLLNNARNAYIHSQIEIEEFERILGELLVRAPDLLDRAERPPLPSEWLTGTMVGFR